MRLQWANAHWPRDNSLVPEAAFTPTASSQRRINIPQEKWTSGPLILR